METVFWLSFFIGLIIGSVIWGFATQAVINNKGYNENWFWWGFFFGIIGFIIALTKPQCPKSEFAADSYDNLRRISAEQNAPGSWRCKKCGKFNASYIGTCACGCSKENNLAEINQNKGEAAKPEPVSETEKIELVVKYKNLLDSGIISNEEFEMKKAELLGTTSEGKKNTETTKEKYSSIEKMVLKLISQNPEGISGLNIAKTVPKNISPEELSQALNHLVEMNEIKLENGIYLK